MRSNEDRIASGNRILHGMFHLWAHRKNSPTEMWTSTDGLHFAYHSSSVAAKNIGTRNATYTRAYEFPFKS